jgi:DNA-binding NarL/FixJ family response regulator
VRQGRRRPWTRATSALPAATALTPTERKVAEFVAAGRTNREVAAELFISVKTVEVYLTRIYRKHGARPRTDLAHALLERGRGAD